MYVSVAPFSEPGMLCLFARHLLSRTPGPTHSLSPSVVMFRDSKVGDSSKGTISHNRVGAPRPMLSERPARLSLVVLWFAASARWKPLAPIRSYHCLYSPRCRGYSLPGNPYAGGGTFMR